MDELFSALIPKAASDDRRAIAKTLAKFPLRMLEFCADAGITVYALPEGYQYRDASPELRKLGIDVDAWPVPPAGLTVCSERRIYLRSRSPMTVAHEFGHGLDLALGSGVYWSGLTPSVRESFAKARAFVTPYSSTGLDEYAAESFRAYADGGINDPSSPWPAATRKRLQRVDPTMFAIVDAVFDRFAPAGDQMTLLH